MLGDMEEHHPLRRLMAVLLHHPREGEEVHHRNRERSHRRLPQSQRSQKRHGKDHRPSPIRPNPARPSLAHPSLAHPSLARLSRKHQKGLGKRLVRKRERKKKSEKQRKQNKSAVRKLPNDLPNLEQRKRGRDKSGRRKGNERKKTSRIKSSRKRLNSGARNLSKNSREKGKKRKNKKKRTLRKKKRSKRRKRLPPRKEVRGWQAHMPSQELERRRICGRMAGHLFHHKPTTRPVPKRSLRPRQRGHMSVLPRMMRFRTGRTINQTERVGDRPSPPLPAPMRRGRSLTRRPGPHRRRQFVVRIQPRTLTRLSFRLCISS